jgi:polysaccharide pyruvyl transferase WcaK-like protein
MPAGEGSLGDEALIFGTHELAERAGRRAAFWVLGPAPSLEDRGLHEVCDARTIVGCAVSRLNGHGRSRAQEADLVVVGADTISGDYEHRFLAARVEALNRAAAAGRSAKLVNCSISRAPSTLSVRLLRRLRQDVEVWARDRPAQARISALLSRPVALAPDVGCLVAPRGSGAFRAPGDEPFAVFVPNAHFSTYVGLDEAALIDAWSEVIRALPMRVVVLPHDVREFPGDVALARRLAAAAGAPLYQPVDVHDAKDVLARASLCVSARMHACVGALSSGTPTVGLEYLEKFRGQFDWYGSLGRAVPEDAVADADAIGRAVAEVLERDRERWAVPSEWFAESWL